MIAKQTFQVMLTKKFSLRERLRVLFGQTLLQYAYVEVTAKYIAKRKEVEIENEVKGVQAFYGIPVKQRIQQLPDELPNKQLSATAQS